MMHNNEGTNKSSPTPDSKKVYKPPQMVDEGSLNNKTKTGSSGSANDGQVVSCS